jgi:tyrosine phenol-lyase
MQFPLEPFRIKMVEPIRQTSREERAECIAKAGFNLFNLRSEDVLIDLLTDSGTGAMSQQQWAAMMLADEAYAGARSYEKFISVARELFGFDHFLPAHQGRAAENILFSTVCTRPGMYIPNNIHFDTTEAHVLSNQAIPVNCVIDEAYDPQVEVDFKGNMDLKKLEDLLSAMAAELVPLVMITLTNNSGGGQPVSMANLAEVARIAKKYQKPLYFDAARFAENAFFIKQREAGYHDWTIKDIVRKMFTYADGMTMSAKKDAIVNIGGFLALNDAELAQRLTAKQILVEGFRTYGGLAGRDLEAMAAGLEEVVDYNYLAYRIGQVAALGQRIVAAGIPVMRPFGGHAIYLNAGEIAAHIPPANFPGQAIAVALYREYGIRSVEIGSLMFAHPDPDSGEMQYPKMELVRLAIPRRVYSASQLDYVAEAVINIAKNPQQLRPLTIRKETQYLRHFTAELQELSP